MDNLHLLVKASTVFANPPDKNLILNDSTGLGLATLAMPTGALNLILTTGLADTAQLSSRYDTLNATAGSAPVVHVAVPPLAYKEATSGTEWNSRPTFESDVAFQTT